MLAIRRLLTVSLMLCSTQMCLPAHAQQAANAGAPDLQPNGAPADAAGIHLFAGVRPWATTWDMPLLDTKTVILNTAGGPVIAVQEVPITIQSDAKIVPLTIVGVRGGDFVISANVAPGTNYSTSGQTSAKVKRTEGDLNLGYAISPSVMVSAVYKLAKVSQLLTSNAASLSGLSYGYRVEGLLVGLNASGPLQGQWSIYGSAAVGLARAKYDGGATDADGKSSGDGYYRIGEVGLSRTLLSGSEGGALKSLALQIGYRFQNVSIRNNAYGTYDATTGAQLSVEHRSTASNTQGFLVGIVGAF